MHLNRKSILYSVLLAGSALSLAVPAQAQDDHHDHNHGASHMARPMARPAARGNFRGGLHGNFRGGARLNRAQATGHFNSFRRGHDFAHFNAADRMAWRGGRWRHGNHHGRNGWWFVVDGGWYFYDTPVYPYPGYVSDVAYDDDYYDNDYGGPAYGPSYGQGYGPGMWWYCDSPQGYYPYIRSCGTQWQAVPATPQSGAMNYPDQGPPDADNGPSDNGPPAADNGPSPDDMGPPPDDNGPPPNASEMGPPPDDNGPPPGMNSANGPPQDMGPPPDDNGPPPPPNNNDDGPQ